MKETLTKWVNDYLEQQKKEGYSPLVWSDGNDIGQLLDELGGSDAAGKVAFDGLCNIADPLNGYGMQAVYWSDKLRRSIILTTDDAFTFENAEEFVEWYMELEAEAAALEKSITLTK